MMERQEICHFRNSRPQNISFRQFISILMKGCYVFLALGSFSGFGLISHSAIKLGNRYNLICTMRTLFSTKRFLLLFALLFTVLLVQTSCETREGPNEVSSQPADAQFKIVDDWSGELIIYLNTNNRYAFGELAARSAQKDPRQAVALLPSDENNSVVYSEIEALISQIESEKGKVTELTVGSADPTKEVKIVFEDKIGISKGINPGFDIPESGDDPAKCDEKCKKLVDVQLIDIVAAANTIQFGPNCVGTNAGNSVIEKALASCFNVEITGAIKGCPFGCICDYELNAKNDTVPRNCFANGDTFTTGNCTLTITGQIKLTAIITTLHGDCKKIQPAN